MSDETGRPPGIWERRDQEDLRRQREQLRGLLQDLDPSGLAVTKIDGAPLREADLEALDLSEVKGFFVSASRLLRDHILELIAHRTLQQEHDTWQSRLDHQRGRTGSASEHPTGTSRPAEALSSHALKGRCDRYLHDFQVEEQARIARERTRLRAFKPNPRPDDQE